MDANYGVGDRIRLKYEVPWVVIHDEGSSSRSTVRSSLVGIKWRFFDSAPLDWQVSTYSQISFLTAGSSVADGGLHDSGTLLLIPLYVQPKVGWLTVNFELGRVRNARGDDGAFGGVVLGHEATERLAFMGELHSKRADRAGLVDALANVGLHRCVDEHGTPLISLGRYLSDDIGARRTIVSYLGWQLNR